MKAMKARRGAREQIPQARSVGPISTLELELAQTLLRRPDRPALVGRQVDDRNPMLVERTDVAQLDRVRALAFDPAQRQSLRSADVRAIGIDPTPALRVEEGAAAFGARDSPLEEPGVPVPYPVGLRIEHGQAVDAAGAATPPALQARGVKDMQRLCLAIDLRVDAACRAARHQSRSVAAGRIPLATTRTLAAPLSAARPPTTDRRWRS
jgi:hypothetical protein